MSNSRVTRSRKRKMQEKLSDLNFYEEGMALDEMEQLDSILNSAEKPDRLTHGVRGRKKRLTRDSAKSWDRAEILEIKKSKTNLSPESSPTFYRKIFVTAIVHHDQDASPKPVSVSQPHPPCDSPISDTDLSQATAKLRHVRRFLTFPQLANLDEIITLAAD